MGTGHDYVMLVFCIFARPVVLFLFPVFAADAIIERRVARRAVLLGLCALGMIVCVFSLAHFGSVDRIHGATGAPVPATCSWRSSRISFRCSRRGWIALRNGW